MIYCICVNGKYVTYCICVNNSTCRLLHLCEQQYMLTAFQCVKGSS